MTSHRIASKHMRNLGKRNIGKKNVSSKRIVIGKTHIRNRRIKKTKKIPRRIASANLRPWVTKQTLSRFLHEVENIVDWLWSGHLATPTAEA